MGPASGVFGDVAEDLLSRLERSLHIMGAVTYAQPDEQIVGARFDLNALDPEDALRIAVNVFSDALSTYGSPRIHRVEVIEEIASRMPA